ncbi:MAG TPA: NBR1-Ig-like domain-containing protein [Anaerolineaceae bacterium]|nr:NBR1-Ig-like domain-containing protein [Anaerolineaceae bacterium]
MGCSIPILSESTKYPDPTRIYRTISAGLTETATRASTIIQTPVPSPSQTSPNLETIDAPIPTTGRETTGTPVLTDIACNLAVAGKPSIDVTIPDGTLLKPGESFTKTWRLVNNGSCTWSTSYAAVWFSGETFSSAKLQNFTYAVPHAESIDVSIDMVAPNEPGIHQSNWKLRSGDGALFGLGPEGIAPFWVRVEVMDLATPGEIPAETATPTSVIAFHDIVILSANNSVDLDIGKFNSGPADDLGLSAAPPKPLTLYPLNGARMASFGSQRPSEADCASFPINGNGIPLSALSGLPYLCYRTNQGQLGMIKLISIKENSLSLEFTTWAVP